MGSDLDSKQDPIKISESRSCKNSESHYKHIPNVVEPHDFYAGLAPVKF
jgi:hypothetical protein